MLLSRWEIAAWTHHDISFKRREPRSLIEARIETGYGPVSVLAAHLGLNPGERRRQTITVAALAEADGLPTVIMGDFNEPTGRGTAGKMLGRIFDSVGRLPTFPSRWPLLPLDRIWFEPAFALVRSGVHRDAGAASDHLPLWADLKLLAIDHPGRPRCGLLQRTVWCWGKSDAAVARDAGSYSGSIRPSQSPESCAVGARIAGDTRLVVTVPFDAYFRCSFISLKMRRYSSSQLRLHEAVRLDRVDGQSRSSPSSARSAAAPAARCPGRRRCRPACRSQIRSGFCRPCAYFDRRALLVGLGIDLRRVQDVRGVLVVVVRPVGDRPQRRAGGEQVRLRGTAP